MRVKCEIGNGLVDVDCVVSLEDEMVIEVMYQGVNIMDAIDSFVLYEIVEAAQKKFAEEMSEP